MTARIWSSGSAALHDHTVPLGIAPDRRAANEDPARMMATVNYTPLVENADARAAGPRFGLAPKLLTLIAGQTILLTALLLVVLHSGAERYARTQAQSFGAGLTDAVASTAAPYARAGAVEALSNVASELEKNKSVEYVDFVTTDGKILARSSIRSMPAPLTKPVQATHDEMETSQNAQGDPIHIFVKPLFESSALANRPGASPAGYVRLAVNEEESRQLRRRTNSLGWLVAFLGLCTVAVSVAMGQRLLVGPVLRLADAAHQIANGDLTGRSSVETSDELGSLSAAFNEMASRLEQTVGKVGRSQKQLSGVLQHVSSRSAAVISGVDRQRGMLDDAYGSIEELNQGIRKITENVDALSTSSEETSSSMLEMAASMEEVSRHTDTLFASVEETASATHQMVSSIKEVDQNVDFLETFVVETSSAMVEMNASITQVESNAARSYDLALAAADAAEAGMRAVRETVEGMEQIRQSVVESSSVMSRLGERSTEIGKILNVIDDIAEQTNLLALNAAILAAQAGEHGRGFSVVAGQIRELSERTASSTREIAGLIGSVQEEVGNAASAMSRGSKMAETGVMLSHEAGKALNRILDSSASASSMGKEIAAATREQARGSGDVAASVGRLRDMVSQINAATTQQAAGSTHILKAVESMREVTRYVRQATVEQKSGSMMISDAADRIIDKVREIFEVASSQAAESEKIVGTIEQIRKISDSNGSSAAEMAESIESLDEAIRGLSEEVQRFRLR